MTQEERAIADALAQVALLKGRIVEDEALFAAVAEARTRSAEALEKAVRELAWMLRRRPSSQPVGYVRLAGEGNTSPNHTATKKETTK